MSDFKQKTRLEHHLSVANGDLEVGGAERGEQGPQRQEEVLLSQFTDPSRLKKPGNRENSQLEKVSEVSDSQREDDQIIEEFANEESKG